MNWRYANTVLVLCMLAFFVTFFARLAISPVVPFILDDFSITNTQIGFGLTGMWLAYGLAQFPSGILADRIGEKSVIRMAVGGTAVTSILVALAPVFSIFVVGVILLGAVAGLHYSVATTLLSRISDNLGTAVGIHSLGAPLSGLIAPIVAAWVGVHYGWRPAVAMVVIIAIPVFLLVGWWIRPTTPRKPHSAVREHIDVGTVRSIVRRPPVIFSLVIAVVSTFVLNGILSFLPMFLVEHRGQTPTMAGLLFASYFVVRGCAQIGIGSVSDRYGRDIAIAICMFLGSSGFVLLVAGPGLVTIAVAIVLAGIGASFFPAIDPRFLDHLTDAEQNAGFGLVRTIYGVLGATGPFGLGLFADLFGWAIAMGLLALFYILLLCGLILNGMFKLGY